MTGQELLKILKAISRSLQKIEEITRQLDSRLSALEGDVEVLKSGSAKRGKGKNGTPDPS
jgi:hypothetical protein